MKGNPKSEENCSPQHLEPCIKATGLNAEAMSNCISDKKLYGEVMISAYNKSKTIQTYPHTTVNGKVQSQGLSAAALKEALCKAGATAAC